MANTNNYGESRIEKLYDNGRLIAEVYYDEETGTYKVINDYSYDYYEGKGYDDSF